jgi:hypothetical protein
VNDDTSCASISPTISAWPYGKEGPQGPGEEGALYNHQVMSAQALYNGTELVSPLVTSLSPFYVFFPAGH